MFKLFSSPSRLISLSLALIGCSGPQAGSDSLNPSAFADRLSKGHTQLVDVRTAAEYADGHLAGALNLDWTGGQLEERAAELDKSNSVLLYCASGRRSAAAREYLHDQGFKEVTDLSGGIQAWAGAGMPVER